MIKIPINLIIAVDKFYGFAKKNSIPWRIREDSLYFSDVTKRNYTKKKNAIIMGKNTWKTLPDQFRGLNERINIVVSSTMTQNELLNDNVTKTEAHLVNNLDQGIELCNKLETGKIFIGGGENIYKEALTKNIIDEIFITQVDKDYDCDKFIPTHLITEILSDFESHTVKKFTVRDENLNDTVQITVSKYYRKGQNINTCNEEENEYLKFIGNILDTGHFRSTRNGKTWSKFVKHLEFDLSKGFPLLTTKKMFFKGIFEELLFFIHGKTNTKLLSEKGVKIWEPNTTRQFLDANGLNTYEEHDMGPMYGYNWLHYGAKYEGMNADYTNRGFNQLEYCINTLKKDLYSRRILMTTYNPAQAKEGCLFPCHGVTIIFNVEGENILSCLMVQRSADYIVGVPFNIASYALLLHMICEVINNDKEYTGVKLVPGRLLITLADVHIYETHYSQAMRQLLRKPYKFPKIKFNKQIDKLQDFKFEDIDLIDYQSYPVIPIKMMA